MASGQEIAREKIAEAKAGRARAVNLNGLRLSKVPLELRNFPGLDTLLLGFNDLTHLPVWMGDFPNSKRFTSAAIR